MHRNRTSDRIVFIFGDTLKEMRVTMREFSLQSGIRPATISAWSNGEAKEINLITLQLALDTLNRLSKEYKINKKYTIEDIFYYEPKDV